MKLARTKNQSPLLGFFDKIYIINLETRIDRLIEVSEELEKIKVDISHPKIKVFKAIKPTDAEDWPTIGTKGCFLSHLGVLEDALKNQYNRILVLEDDVNFNEDFNPKFQHIISQLSNTPWNIFYGGYRTPDTTKINTQPQTTDGKLLENLIKPNADTQVICCHFVAFNKQTIAALAPYLAQISLRPMGHPEGGKMHVDGAYSWFREKHPEVITYLASPELCYQRSSATDIHELKWYDVLPIFKAAASAARKIKNHFA